MSNWLEEALFLLGGPVSPLYSAFMRLRRRLYETGFLDAFYPGIPVISIGNILLGGTGKTPLVEEVVKWALERGMRPAVLTRGYKGTVGQGPKELIEKDKIIMGPWEAGDEPYMLALRLIDWCSHHGVPQDPMIIVGSNRVASAKLAKKKGADLIVLDDGFQHLHLKRDIDILLFPYDIDPSAQRVFPGGRLREPLDAARHAHIVVVSKLPDMSSSQHLAFFKGLFPGKECCPMAFIPESLIPLSDEGSAEGLELLEGKRVVAFCGIGHPQSFKKMILGLGCNLVDMRIFGDHHFYADKELLEVRRWSREKKADMILTTEKDLVKLGFLASSSNLQADDLQNENGIYAIRLKVEVDPHLFSLMAGYLHI